MVAAVRRARSWWRKHPVTGWGIVATLTAAIVIGAFVLPAMGASTPPVYPSGITLNGWTLTGTAATALDTNDGGTSRIYVNVDGSPAVVALDNPAPVSGSVITSVDVYTAANCQTDDDMTIALRVGTNTSAATTVNVPQGAFDAATYPTQAAINFATAPDGSPWGTDWTIIDNLAVVVGHVSVGGGDYVRVSQVYIVVNYTTDSTPPTLVSATSTDATHVTVTFSEDLDATSVATSDFDIPGLTVTGVSVSGSTVTLTTSVQDAISYDLTVAAGGVDDLAGNGNTVGTRSFTGTDGIAPALISATSTDATHVSVVFSEPIASGSVTTGDFDIPGLTVSGVSVSGSTVTLTTSVQDAVSYDLTVAAGGVDDLAGNGNTVGTRSFTGTDGIAPTLVSATSTDATHVTVTFSEEIDAASVDATDFDIPGLTVTDAVVSGSTVTLTTSVQDGVSYALTVAAGSVDDLAGNGNTVGTRNFAGTDGTPPTLVSAASTDSTHISVTFSEPIDEATVDVADFDIPGLTVSGVSVSGSTVTLTTSAQDAVNYTLTVAAGSVDDLAANGNTVGTRNFTGTDGIAPTLVSAVSTGSNQVEVTFSEPVDATSVTSSDFSIAGLTVTGASVAGSTVTLATSSQAAISYTLSVGAGNVRDTAGNPNEAGSTVFVGYDPAPPTLDVATAPNATHVNVVFSHALRESSVAASDFSISGLTVSAAVLNADGVTVRLTTSAQTGGTVYTVTCAAGNVLSISGVGNLVGSAAFTGSGVADSSPPTDPADVTATPGVASPTIAALSWLASTDDIGVVGYRVYRAANAAGPFTRIGTTSELTFSDVTGVPGQEYWYRVAAFDAAGNESARVAASGTPITATWTQLPHTVYTRDTNLCKLCHVPHVAASAGNILRDAGSAPAELAVCYACHDGSGASTNVKTGAVNSFVGASGHTLEAAPVEADADLTNACASCHGPHGDVATRSKIPRSTVNGVTIGAAGNDWCGACHNEAASWYKPGGYAALLAEPSRDDTGYPVAGTYPGPTVYADPIKNPHATIPAATVPSPMVPTQTVDRVQGDCLWCHDAHRSSASYDGLIDEFRPSTASTLADDQGNGTYAALCFTCHDGDADWVAKGASDIKTLVTAGGPRSGHRIQTAGALYPVDAPLPCYECHNPHGSSASKGGLAVMTMLDGTTKVLLGDSAGEIDVSTPQGVRDFCFSCHTTAGSASGVDVLPYGWNGSAYVQIASGAKVAGVSRLAYDQATKSGLKLPPVNGHYRDNTDSCAKCHGNIHNPSPGLSDGGVPCYGCHSVYQGYMEDNVGALKGGPERLQVYHHVMGSGTQDGDIAPGPGGTYPSFSVMTNDVYCVSCHVDHDLFNDTPGANLRANLGLNPTAGADSDFVASEADGGICTSCHKVALTKDTTDQKPGTTTAQKVDPSAYKLSSHQYRVGSEFGTGNTFYADCSKCHNDEQAKEFATSTYKFGTHWSESNRILSAFGGTVAESLGEEHCYGCHTGGTDANDYYDTAPMTAAARSTEDEFGMTSKHDLTKVECVNCHNAHTASATSPVADPDNTYTAAAWSAEGDKTAFCMKCHDGSAPVQTINNTTLIPYTVTAGARANVATNYTTTGHGMSITGTPFVNRTNTRYATAFNPQVGAWTNGSNSIGAQDAAVATSPTNNVFDGRHTFTMPVGMTSISAANLTVRSRAAGAWGAVLSTTPGSQIRYPSSDVAVGNWAEGVAGADGDTLRWNEIDDPAATPDDAATYINGTGTGEYQAGIAAPSIPANATNISVSIIWRARDGAAASNQTVWSRMRYNGVWSNAAIINRNPANTTWNTYTDTWATAPGGAAWTPANVALVTGVGVDQSANVSQWVTQMYVEVSYEVSTSNDDTWAIQYTTNGTAWVNLPGSPSTAAEGALTDHTVNLGGILTPANAGNFAVRILGASTGAADNAGTIEWDSSSLALTYSGVDPGARYAECRACHEQHGSTLPKLLTTTVDGQTVPAYSDTADQAQCLACHRAGGAAGSANIAQYYPTTAYGTAVQDDLPVWERFGHRIKTGPNAGQTMPCRSCHNPHGSADSGYMLAVRTQVTAGVDTIIGLTAGQLVMEDSTQIPANANNVRRFCFTCHTASDNSQGWNGSTMAVVPAGAQVMGISRTGGVLKVPDIGAIPGHKAAETSYSCYLCHGDDFSAPGSVNVHNPAAGESRGGIPCYVCHTVYRDQMEDGTGSQVGASRQLTYHHVLGGAVRDGDSITYPALTADGRENVYCLSCHVDHDEFSPFVNGANQRSRNLRAAYDNAVATAANTDWSAAGGGVCLGCHSIELTRDNTNQKAETNSTKTPAIGSAAYDASAHQYVATSTFTDASTFNGNCVKCHDSEIDGGGMEAGKSTTGFQASTGNQFSVHYSANRRILAAMGVPLTEPLVEERTCYACHSVAGQGFKTTANRDWYDAADMTAVSQATYSLMNSTYKHNVSGYQGLHRPSPTDETQAYISANKHVECDDCHNVHAATATRHTRGTNAVSGTLAGVSGVRATYPAGAAGSNYTGPSGYVEQAATTESQICFKCHSSANTSYQAWGGTGSQAWTNVALDFSPNNGSYHPVVAALPVTDPNTQWGSNQLRSATSLRGTLTLNGWTTGGFTRGQTMYCSDCHASGPGGGSAASLGPHGSAVKWMLHGPNQAWPYQSAADNGSARTDNFAYLDNANATTYTQNNVMGTNNVFCLNCHVLNTVGTVHSTTDKHGETSSRGCVMCHVRVPHGSKASRLQAVVGSNTVYPGAMPARLTPTGVGTRGTGMGYTTGYVKGTGAAQESSCSVAGGCGTHPNSPLGTSDARW